MFSTMTTAPSMMRPKSTAPRLIRFPEMPNCLMPVRAKRNDRGMAQATMSAARQLPSRSRSTTITSTAPSDRFFSTVPMVWPMRMDRSYCVWISTPAGSLVWISASRALTRPATSRLFSPASIMVVPMTVSFPSKVAAPVRNLVPTFTSATSFTRSGLTAPPNFSGRSAMSSTVCTRLTARMVNCCPPRLMMPPPAFSTFCATRSASSLKVIPASVRRSGLGWMTNCRS